MAVESYMDFFGHEITGTKDAGEVRVEYRIKYNAPRVVAVVAYEKTSDDPLVVSFRLVDAGRKTRNTKADADRGAAVLRVARNWWRRTYMM